MNPKFGFPQFAPFPALIFASVFLCLCSCSEESGTNGAKNQNALPIHEFTWETTGGGQVKFRVAPAGESEFSIYVLKHDFKSVGVDLSLTPSDGEAYQLAVQIFNGKLDLHKETFTPRGATGSWTSITAVTEDCKSLTIKNITPGDRLRPLSQFIGTKLPGG